jgi:outer membrane protein assembly factor BamA
MLRGYPAGFQGGQHFTLANAEYRFPIVNFDRGSSTLPIFWNRLTGAVFFDYGAAFDVVGEAKYKSGTGGELWLETFLGYGLSMTFRLGYARGLASEGIDKIYFVAAVPY